MPSNWHTNEPGRASSCGRLYVVATPIGNLEDITLRALKILDAVDLVAAEDTRRTGRLLSHHAISTDLISYHEHNESRRTPLLLERLLAGASIALVSDAGTPSVSDPGYRLVRAALDAGLPIVPVPGVSAVTAALSVCGLPTDSFVFVGFPTRKGRKRRDQMERLAAAGETLIFYESAKRMMALLADLAAVMGDRRAVLCREMTKIHEEFLRGPLSAIMQNLGQRSPLKGECTLLVAGRPDNAIDNLASALEAVEKGLTDPETRLSDLVQRVSRSYGVSKKRIYTEALKLKELTTSNNKENTNGEH